MLAKRKVIDTLAIATAIASVGALGGGFGLYYLEGHLILTSHEK